MYSNYAAYTSIDRFVRTAVHLSFFTDYASGTFFQPFKNSPRELLVLFLSYRLAILLFLSLVLRISLSEFTGPAR